MKNIFGTIAGAVIGGILGYFAFFWIARQGFYGMVIPGGLLGTGAGFAKPKSNWLAASCGVAALALGVFTEWKFDPFMKGESFTHFVLHIFDKEPITLLMIALGGAAGFWIPFRRSEPRQPPVA